MNSQLQNNKFNIPYNILDYLKFSLNKYNNHDKGKHKCQNYIEKKFLTHAEILHLKNFFDTFNPQTGDKIEYELSGGNLMRNFVNTHLNIKRNDLERSKHIKGTVSNNTFKKSYTKPMNKVQKPIDVNKSIKNTTRATNYLYEGIMTKQEFSDIVKNMQNNSSNNHHSFMEKQLFNKANKHLENLGYETNNMSDEVRINILKDVVLNKNINITTIVCVINKENKVLLLKRSHDDVWCPSCWGFPGGMVDKGEEPSDACIRELYEEAGIIVPDVEFVMSVNIENKNMELRLYKCYVDNNYVKISHEHSKYGWASITNIEKITKSTPNLLQYVVACMG